MILDRLAEAAGRRTERQKKIIKEKGLKEMKIILIPRHR